MYLPRHFEETRPDVLRLFIEQHPFGLLVTQAAAGPVANGMPFLFDADGSAGLGTLRAHVARANPVWHEAPADVPSLVVFQGPEAYISPAWYPSKAEHGKVVPTWNYVIVQARGHVRAIDDADWLRRLVTRLTERHEGSRPQPWAVSDAPADYVDTMLRAIVGIEIELVSLTGKWKVSQNRSVADRAGVAAALDGIGSDASHAMADEVRAAGRDA